MRYPILALAILTACAQVPDQAGDAPAHHVDANSDAAVVPTPRPRPQYVVISPQWPDE